MSTQTSPDSRAFGRVLERSLHAPLRRQTYRNLVYLVLMTPLGTIYFTLILTGFVFGLSFAVVVIGIPIFVLVLALSVELAGFERQLVRGLLRVDIPSTTTVKTDQDRWSHTKQFVTDRRTWKAVAYLLSEFVYGTFVGGLIVSGIVTGGNFLLAPLYYTQAPVVAYGPLRIGAFTLEILFGWNNLLVGLTTTFRIGSWQIETLLGALLVSGLGIVLLVVVLPIANALMEVWGRYARVMLTAPRYWETPRW